jgi:hypothetical protein
VTRSRFIGSRRGLWVAYAFALVLACRNPEPNPPPGPPRRQAPARTAPQSVPVQGAERSLRETTLFADSLPSGDRLEMRLLAVTGDSTTTFSSTHEVLLEVRTGEVTTIRQGERLRLEPGRAWSVAPRERIRFWAAGQAATIRAIYLIPAARRPG